MIRTNKWKLLLLAGDGLVVAAAVYISLYLRFNIFGQRFDAIGDPFRVFTGASTLTILPILLVLYFSDSYRAPKKPQTIKYISRLLLTLSIVPPALATIFYLIPSYKMYRLAYMYSFILSTLFLLFWRLQFFKHIFPMLPRQKMLILGAGATGELVAQTTLKHMDSLMEIVGFLDDDTTKKTPPEGTLKILGSSQDALALCEKHQIDLVIVAITSDLRKETIYELMQLKMRGTDILDGVSFLKQMTGKIPIFHINETWLLFGPNFNLAKPGTLTKFQRQFDIIASSIGLTLTFPLLLIIACLLKISSKGPVVFRQERLGHMKKPYTILKFRTMIDNAEENSGAVWAEKNDPRVTPFGRFLRRTRLDELPQLWNVLSGEMSLIGPRPERKAFVDQLEKEIPYYPLRFTAKPGLTGWAQVNYRYGSSTDDAMEKLQYDLYYLQEMSVLLNLIILLRTVQTVILKPGS